MHKMQTGAGEPVPVCRKGVFGLYIKDNFYGVFLRFKSIRFCILNVYHSKRR